MIRNSLNITRYAFLVAVTVGACGCNESSQTASSDIVLTREDVSTLLGIGEADELEIGSITSGSDGVTVSFVRFRNDAGIEVDVGRISMSIESSEDFQYGITTLNTDRIDFHDWQSTQRTTLTSVSIAEPRAGFLRSLEELLADRSADSFSSSGLQFEGLKVEKFEYLLRDDEGGITRVEVDGFIVAEATNERLGKVAARRISLPDGLVISGFEVSNAERQWVDLLLMSAARQTVEAELIRSTQNTGRRTLPFDSISVGQLDAPILSANDTDLPVRIKDASLEVVRSDSEDYVGVTALATLDLPVSGLPDEARRLLRTYPGTTNAEWLSVAFSGEMTVEDLGRVEHYHNVTIRAPELFSLTGSLRARSNVVRVLADGLVRLRPPEVPDFEPVSLQIEAADRGLVRYLLSQPSSESGAELRKTLVSAREKLASIGRLDARSSPMPDFLADPGRILVSIETESPLRAGDFFESAFSPSEERRSSSTIANVRFQTR